MVELVERYIDQGYDVQDAVWAAVSQLVSTSVDEPVGPVTEAVSRLAATDHDDGQARPDDPPVPPDAGGGRVFVGGDR